MNDNPIRFDRIDRDALRGMELDYRQRIFSPDESRAFASQVFVLVFLIALAVAGSVSLVGPWFTTRTGFIVGSALGVVLAGLALLRAERRIATSIKCLIVAPLLPVLFFALAAALSVYVGRVCVLGVFVLFLGYMTDRILTHAQEWLLAHPSFGPVPRVMQKIAWQNRFFQPLPQEPAEISDGVLVRHSDRYRRGPPTLYSYKLAGCCATVFVLMALCQVSGPFALYYPLALMALGVAVCLYSFSRYQGGIRNGWSCTRQTLVHWLYYGKVAVPAPGLFQGSCGSFFSRIVRSLILLSGLSLSVVTLTDFMPVARPFVHTRDKTNFARLFDYHGAATAEEDSFLVLQGFTAPSRRPALRPGLPEWASFLKRTLGGFSPTSPPSLEPLIQETFASTLERAKESKDPAELIGYYRPLWNGQVDSWIDRDFSRFYDTRPSRWLGLALIGLADGQFVYLLVIIANVLSCIIIPVLILFAFLAFPLPSTIGDRFAGQTKLAPHEIWDAYATRLLESKNPSERQHLWLGIHALNDYPVLLHRKILSEHAYFVGDTGSGKTALGIIPLLTQLIRHSGRDVNVAAERARQSRKSEEEVLRLSRQAGSAMVIIDLKGDKALFEAARIEAHDAGLRFKFFTNELQKPTYCFNPFRDLGTGQVSVNSTCEAILESLNLSHGEGYGRSYFTRHARKWLSATLLRDRFQKGKTPIQTFGDLFRLIAEDEGKSPSTLFEDPEQRRNVFELLCVIQSLATFDQLNVAAGAPEYSEAVVASAIHMPDVIANNEVVYFWLPAAVEVASVREIAKLAIYSLLRAAVSQPREGGQPKQTYLVIDEFQRMASEGFKIILEQARSMGLSAILANQTVADLKTHDTDLRPTVQTNTRLKQCFSATDLEQQDNMMKASGEMIRETSTTFTSGGKNETTSQTFGATQRLLRNRVLWTSDDPMQSILQVHRGSGFTQYGGLSIPVAGSYHISQTEHTKRTAAPWPEQTDETYVAHDRPLPDYAFRTAEERVEVGVEVGEIPEPPPPPPPKVTPSAKSPAVPEPETARPPRPVSAPQPEQPEPPVPAPSTRPVKDHRAHLKSIATWFFDDEESD